MGEILKTSDDSVQHLGLLGFWTLSMTRYPKEEKTMFQKLDLFPSSGASISSRDGCFILFFKISDGGQVPKTQ
jgi:hypothetical protein